MNSRERVIRSIEFTGPDRIPFTHAYLDGTMKRYKKDLVELLKEFPQDFGPSDHSEELKKFEGEEFKGEDYRREYTDEWGTVWLDRYDGILGQILRHPLEDWNNLKDYVPPEAPAIGDREFGEERKKVAEYKKQWLTQATGGNFFERLQWLRGYADLLIDLVDERRELNILADMVLDYNMKLIERALALGVDEVVFADDWGTQRQVMINPELWRKFFKPYYKKMFEAVHQGGAYVFFHSDGYIIDYIPDLMEIGVDTLNPQFSCMDLREVAKLTSGKLCIHTDLDRQYIMPYGIPEQVKEHVKDIINILGDNQGGLRGQGWILPDVPLENARAMFEAFIEYGKYPLF